MKQCYKCGAYQDDVAMRCEECGYGFMGITLMKIAFAKTKITPSESEITIEISPTSSMFDEILQNEKISLLMLCLGSGLSIAVAFFLANNEHFLIAVPLLACAGVFFGLFPILYTLIKKETIRLSQASLFLKASLWGIGKTHRYLLSRITDIRPTHQRSRLKGKIRFLDGGQEVFFGARLSPNDTTRLVEYVNMVLRFRCHHVERLHFGIPPHSDGSQYSSVLHNPDLSPLTIPFIRLKELTIDVATYDFRLVEKFLTYGVNYLGQRYLRERVIVHVYGEIRQLQTNLRNALTNVCHGIEEHEQGSLT